MQGSTRSAAAGSAAFFRGYPVRAGGRRRDRDAEPAAGAQRVHARHVSALRPDAARMGGGPGGPRRAGVRRRRAGVLRRRGRARDLRGRARNFRRARSDLGLLPGRIPADPPRPSLSEAVSGDHRRRHDGRRGRSFGQRRLPDRDREDAAGDAGDRDRPVSRCRRDALPQFVPRPYRPLSRIDRGTARPGRRALLRLRDAFRAARAGAGPDRGACRPRLARRCRTGAARSGVGVVPQRSRRAAACRASRRDRPLFRRGNSRSDPRCAGPRGGVGRFRRRMGGRDARFAADQVADQPQGHAAAAGCRARLRSRTGARARIPADNSISWSGTISTRACARSSSTRTRTRAGGRRASTKSATPRSRAISRHSAVPS